MTSQQPHNFTECCWTMESTYLWEQSCDVGQHWGGHFVAVHTASWSEMPISRRGWSGLTSIGMTTLRMFCGQTSVLCSWRITGDSAVESKDSAQSLRPSPKHPFKVHVWAGISKKGKSKICIFEGIMERFLFTDILDSALIPSINHIAWWWTTIQNTLHTM